MSDYFKQHGERLAELGYLIVPLPPGSKGPRRKGWPKFRLEAEAIRKMAANGSAHDGVGILAATTPAIDVDILDPQIADQMSQEIDRIFAGQSLMTRTGRAPKFLIPFRSDEPFRKLSSHVYTDGKHEHKVEILGDGQQWVAYHVHPDTEKPYLWFDGVSSRGIRDVARDLLPRLTRSDAQRVIDAFEILAAERVKQGVWHAARLVERHSLQGNKTVDDFAAHAEPVKDLTRAQIESLVHKCDHTDYEEWIDVGMRLHHQYAGSVEGFEIWDAWSANSPKYDAEVMEGHWGSFGHRTDAPKTVRGLIERHGQPAKVAAPAQPHPQATEDDPVPFTEGSQFAEGFEDIDWLIEDVVPRAQVGVVYGASGSGKTFFALDMACAVQRGGVWRLKQIERADTFYIAAEAGNGIKKRIAAYLQHYGPGAMPWFVDYQPNLATLESVHAISGSVKLRSASPGLIFVDTLALSHDGDENSSKDMSTVLRHCKVLSDDTGALVILVHHTGKDESKGMRGSSSLYAGADFVLEVVAKDKDRTMIVDKLKDGERGAKFGFSLQSVEVGATPRGKVITSCYVKEEEKTITRNEGKPLTNEQQIFIFEVFRESLGMAAEMTETELVEAVKTKQKANGHIPSQSQSIRKSIAKIAIAGHICKEGERLSEPHSVHSASF